MPRPGQPPHGGGGDSVTTYPMVANAWQRHPSVDFRGTGISETIQVRPSSNPSNPEAVAESVYAIAEEIRAGTSPRGDRVVLRPWFNLNWGAQPRAYYEADHADDPNNRYNLLGPYQPTVLPAYLTEWWSAFNARSVALGLNPDALVLDNEVRPDYWSIPAARRQAYFAPITIDEEHNPYPNPPSPYLGVVNLGATGNTTVGRFISEYNQWGADDLTTSLAELHAGVWSDEQAIEVFDSVVDRLGSMPESGTAEVRIISNYRDAAYSFDIGDTSNRPEREPQASTRVALISAPIAYFNRRLGLALLTAEPEYTTTRAIANRERWKSCVYRLNSVRSCAGTEPGDVHPWIQSPGWGWNGGEGWANATQLPFELIHWRAWMEHYAEMGVWQVQLWNPIPSVPGSNDPHALITHTYMAEWFRGRMVGPLMRDLPLADITERSVTTGRVTTRFADLHEMTTVYYRRSSGYLFVPYSQGWPWSPTDPLVISAGAAGDAELAAMLNAIANNQGHAVVAQEIESDTMPEQQVVQRVLKTYAVITADMLRGNPASIGCWINPGDEGFDAFEGVKAQVRRSANSAEIYDFSPPGNRITLEPTDDGRLTFVRQVSTADWPTGKCYCDVFVTVNGLDYGVARYEWEIIGAVTRLSA